MGSIGEEKRDDATEKNIGMSYINQERKSQVLYGVSSQMLIIWATKKLFLIVKSVHHFYKVRV